MSDNIKVAVRVRPLLKSKRETTSCWKVENNTIAQCDTNTRRIVGNLYAFDEVVGQKSTTQDLFTSTALPIVDSFLSGINGTIFAYGQTASGKTYTISGTAEQPGLIPLCVDHLFNYIENNMDNMEFLIRVSYIELYNEKFSDLLDTSEKTLKIRERTDENASSFVYIDGISEEMIQERGQILQLLSIGNRRRHTGETLANRDSSRSHSIFKIVLESRERSSEEDDGIVRVSHLNLVDLAGSERVSLTGATGERLKEGCHINLSLSALTSVINKLGTLTPDQKNTVHIPFRDSKLTRILQSALGGNSKTAIICAISPASADIEFSTSTLKFATNAKRIKNKPVINEVMSDEALLKQYMRKIANLEKALEEQGAGNPDLDNLLSEKEDLHKQLLEKETKEREQEEKIRQLRSMILTTPGPVNAARSKPKMKGFKRRETWCPGQLVKAGLMPPPATIPDFAVPHSLPIQPKKHIRRSIYEKSQTPERIYNKKEKADSDFKSAKLFTEQLDSLTFDNEPVDSGPVTQRKKVSVQFDTPEADDKPSVCRQIQDLERIVDIYCATIDRLDLEKERLLSQLEKYVDQEDIELFKSPSPVRTTTRVVRDLDMSMSAGICNVSLTAEMQVAELEALREELKTMRQLENELKFFKAENEILRPLVEENEMLRPLVEENEMLRPLVEENDVLRPLIDKVEKLNKLEEEVVILRVVKKEYDGIQKTNCEAEMMAEIAHKQLERVKNEKMLCEEKICEFEAAAEGGCGHSEVIAELETELKVKGEASRKMQESLDAAQSCLEVERKAHEEDMKKLQAVVSQMETASSESLEKQVADLDIAKAGLGKELEELRAEHESCSVGKDEAEKLLASSEELVEILKSEMRTLKQDAEEKLEALKVELGTVEKQLTHEKVAAEKVANDRQSEIEELNQVLETLIFEKQAVDADVEENKGEIDRLIQSRDELKEGLSEKLGRITTLEETRASLESSMGVAEAQVTELQAGLTEKSQKVSSLEELLGIIESEKDDLEKTVAELMMGTPGNVGSGLEDELRASLERQVAVLESEKTALEERIRELVAAAQTNTDLAKQVSALEEEGGSHQENITSLQSQVSTLEVEKSELEAQIEDLICGVNDSPNAGVEMELDSQKLARDLECKVRELEQVVVRVEEERELTVRNLEDLRASYEKSGDVEAKLVAELRWSIEEKLGRITTLEETMASLERSKGVAEAQVTELQAGFIEKSQKVSSLEELVGIIESEKDDLEKTVAELMMGTPGDVGSGLEGELRESLEKQVAVLESEKSALEEQIRELVMAAQTNTDLAKQVSALEEEGGSHQENITSLQSQVSTLEVEKSELEAQIEDLICGVNDSPNAGVEMDLDSQNLVRDLECKVRELEQVVVRVEEERELTVRNLEDLRASYETSGDVEAKLVAELRWSVEEKLGRITTLEETMASSERSKGVAEAQVTELQAGLIEKSQKVSSLEELVGIIESEKDDLEKTVAELMMGTPGDVGSGLEGELHESLEKQVAVLESEKTALEERIGELVVAAQTNTDLAKQVSALEEEGGSHQENITSLQSQVSTLQVEKSELEAQIEDLICGVNDSPNAGVEMELDSQKLVRDLECKVCELEQVVVRVEEERELTVRNLEDLRASYETSGDVEAKLVAELRRSVEEKQRDVAQLEEILQGGKMKLETLQALYDRLVMSTADLKQELEEMKQRKQQLKLVLLRKQKRKTTESTESAISYEKLLEKNQRLQSDVEYKEVTIQRLNTNWEEVEAEYQEVSDQLKAEQAVTADLRQKLDQQGSNSQQSDLQEIAAQLEAEKQTTKKFKEAYLTQKSTLQSLQQTVSQCDDEIKEVEEELSEEKKRSAELEKKLEILSRTQKPAAVPEPAPVPTDAQSGGSIIDSVNNMMLAGDIRALKKELKDTRKDNERMKRELAVKEAKATQLEHDSLKECPQCAKAKHQDLKTSGARLPLKEVAPVNVVADEFKEEDGAYGGNWAEKFTKNRRKALGVADEDDPTECQTS